MSSGSPDPSSPKRNSLPAESSCSDSKRDVDQPNELGEKLLDCVFRETLSAVGDDSTIERIRSFVWRNRERDVTELPVAEALVDEIIKSRFGRVAMPDELPHWIATLLLDDPHACERLQSIWTQAKNGTP